MPTRFSTVQFVLLFSGCIIFADQLVGRDGDLFTHVAYGEHIWKLGMRAPDSTIYTTTNAPVLHEWLYELLLYAVVMASGLGGALVAAAIVWAAIPTVLFVTMARRHGFWPGLFASSISLVGLGSSFTIRPHMVSWILFVLTLLVLPRRSALWPWILIIAVVWANVHGGASILLPLMIAAYAVGDFIAGRRRVWSDAGLMVGTLLCLCVNPYGPLLFKHLLEFMLLGDLNLAQDMKPPNFATGTAITFAAITVFCLAGMRGANWPERVLLFGLWLMCCTAMRHLPFFGIAAAAFATSGVATRLSSLRESSSRLYEEFEGRPSSMPALIVVVVLLGAAVRVADTPKPTGPSVPRAAISWLTEHPSVARQRGYAGYNYAGYLFYNTPVNAQYLHGLNANIPLSLMLDLRSIMAGGDEAAELLDEHEVQWVVVHRGDPLASALEAWGWHEQLHSDDDALLFSRDLSRVVRQSAEQR